MIRERLTAQLLAGTPARSATEVAARLLAVQAQDPRGARLAVRARSAGVTAADVDRALTVDRSLVVSWLNRGTLHLVRREDYGWLHALLTPPLRAGSARRLAQTGVTPAAADRAVAVIERSLSEDGPLTRLQLRERIARDGVPVAGQALVHLLFLASLRGVAVRGPMAGREQAYALTRAWLGAPAPVERDRALAELARRYLAGHGPSSDRDLARWAGLPLRDAHRGLSAIAGELRERPDGLTDLARRPAAAALPRPRLLGAFEPVLLGWRSREAILDGHDAAIVTGGLFRPFALVRGRAVASWRIAGGAVELQPFAQLSQGDVTELLADGDRVMRFLALGRGGGAASIAPPGRDSSAGRAHD
ncbi:MAG: AlkZ family DNA glycosylase [Solirubrobacterales bacterium]|nr:AlkZ family DNA glycosylase [Solirubrobacterales bacterium]